MDEERDRWTRFSNPDFGFEFEHPTVGPSGAHVTIERIRHPHGEAIHLQTEDAREVYFELDRRDDGTAVAGIGGLQADVMSRFPDAWFGDPEATELCGLPSVSLRFRFGEKMRWAIFTDEANPSYRVILDPRSSTNLAILGTVTRRGQ